MRRATEE